MSLRIYDSNQVTVMIAGLPIDVDSGGSGGYADDEFLTIARETPVFTDVVGTDGEVTRSKTNDHRATVTLKLMQTSRSNAALAALHALDRNATNGAGVGAFMVKDLNGLSLYTAAECWISAPPEVAFGRAAASREWTVRVATLADFTGGN
jgi:hypothetical protein